LLLALHVSLLSVCLFFFHPSATTEIYTLSLHDALPIYPHLHQPRAGRPRGRARRRDGTPEGRRSAGGDQLPFARGPHRQAVHCRDRKSTRLNSSHVKISYAVFCLKKKKINDYGSKTRDP